MIGASRKARVLSEGEFDALSPLVETEEMEILDLSMPDAPKLAAVVVAAISGTRDPVDPAP